MMRLPRCYPLTDSAQGVAMLASAGARLIQLRIKQASPDGLRQQVLAAQAICHRHGASLVLNDHWQLALELRLEWLHLGQEDLDQADWAACRQHGLKLGLSTHDEAELERALLYAPDYIALGPIWPSRLKSMHWAAQGLARIGEWKHRLGARPLVAIGGITLERAPACLHAGADVLAVSSDISRAAEPAERARQWVQRLDQELALAAGQPLPA